MNLSSLVATLSAELHGDEHWRTGVIYRSTLHSVCTFGGTTLLLNEVFSTSFLVRYEAHLLGRGCFRNTTSFYLRALRAMYNKAVQRGWATPISGLFDQVFTGNDPTEKRALSPDTLFHILEVELSDDKILERTRDLFALTFFLHGMPFIDLIYLRKDNVRQNAVVYYRRKTRKTITVPLDEQTRKLLAKYADSSDSPYFFPYITEEGEAGRKQYENLLHNQNWNLKRLAQTLGITEKLTTYVSRHTWATIAYHSGVELPVISQAMGHQNQEVTRVYLAEFRNEVLRRAGEMVIQAIYGTKKRKENKGTTGKKKYPSPCKRRTFV